MSDPAIKKILIFGSRGFPGELLQSELESEGHTVFLAYSGEEALALIECERPDLILIDMVLSKIEGRKALRCLQKAACRDTDNHPV